MAKAWHRGHEVSYDWDTRRWTYADGVPTIVERPCVRCGRMPTPDGHDACLGVIPGASSACCGHGVVEGFVMSGSNSAEECQPSKLDVAGSNPASRSRHNASATDSVGSPNLVPRSESTGGAIPPACSKTVHHYGNRRRWQARTDAVYPIYLSGGASASHRQGSPV